MERGENRRGFSAICDGCTKLRDDCEPQNGKNFCTPCRKNMEERVVAASADVGALGKAVRTREYRPYDPRKPVVETKNPCKEIAEPYSLYSAPCNGEVGSVVAARAEPRPEPVSANKIFSYLASLQASYPNLLEWMVMARRTLKIFEFAAYHGGSWAAAMQAADRAILGVHPERPMNTVSRRWSSEPNLQNIPRTGLTATPVRKPVRGHIPIADMRVTADGEFCCDMNSPCEIHKET